MHCVLVCRGHRGLLVAWPHGGAVQLPSNHCRDVGCVSLCDAWLIDVAALSDLSGNKLTLVAPDAFAGLQDLETLYACRVYLSLVTLGSPTSPDPSLATS